MIKYITICLLSICFFSGPLSASWTYADIWGNEQDYVQQTQNNATPVLVSSISDLFSATEMFDTQIYPQAHALFTEYFGMVINKTTRDNGSSSHGVYTQTNDLDSITVESWQFGAISENNSFSDNITLPATVINDELTLPSGGEARVDHMYSVQDDNEYIVLSLQHSDITVSETSDVIDGQRHQEVYFYNKGIVLLVRGTYEYGMVIISGALPLNELDYNFLYHVDPNVSDDMDEAAIYSIAFDMDSLSEELVDGETYDIAQSDLYGFDTETKSATTVKKGVFRSNRTTGSFSVSALD